MAEKHKFLKLKNEYSDYDALFEAVGIFNHEDTSCVCGSISAKILLALSGNLSG